MFDDSYYVNAYNFSKYNEIVTCTYHNEYLHINRKYITGHILTEDHYFDNSNSDYYVNGEQVKDKSVYLTFQNMLRAYSSSFAKCDDISMNTKEMISLQDINEFTNTIISQSQM